MSSLKGKVAIVTGGVRGIGRGIALELAKNGAKVAVTYVSDSSKDLAAELVSQIDELVGANSGIAIQADIADLKSGELVLAQVQKKFGQDTVDILINNAGTSKFSLLEDLTEEDFDLQFGINVKGLIFFTKAILPALKKSKSGRIINLSSGAARSGQLGATVYGSTKASINSLTKVWATELGRKYGITVLAVNPGPVITELFNTSLEKSGLPTPPFPAAAERLGQPEDIAEMVGLLVTEKSHWFTGEVVNVNGGRF
ncbi:BA75_01852T0 [Komagataella pastoris]|uniref:BA75_01852T0 n=1 Tax=Komagataella pastoris TaxID=4922 RepID=A0A1B2J7Q0_PICPA|nr:BA75_01852T0 [Komagataella pastoris]